MTPSSRSSQAPVSQSASRKRLTQVARAKLEVSTTPIKELFKGKLSIAGSSGAALSGHAVSLSDNDGNFVAAIESIQHAQTHLGDVHDIVYRGFNPQKLHYTAPRGLREYREYRKYREFLEYVSDLERKARNIEEYDLQSSAFYELDDTQHHFSTLHKALSNFFYDESLRDVIGVNQEDGDRINKLLNDALSEVNKSAYHLKIHLDDSDVDSG